MILGLRGTGDWATDQRPKNWRETILFLYPNGDAPLTALLSKLGEEKTDDPEFNWWTKNLPEQAGAITGIFTDAGFANAYATGAVAGDVLYVRVAAATVAHFRDGHIVLLRDTSDYNVDCVGKCVGVVSNGAASMIAVQLLEADDNSLAHDLSDADRILVIGNSNAEGAEMPDAISYNPVKYWNYTQIFRTPLSITRTARKTRLRTGEQYKESKRECLELHSIEMEKGFLWGIRTERVGDNGKPERTTWGMIPMIRTNIPGNCSDYTLDPNFAGTTWENGGEEWLDNFLEQLFRYGADERMAFAGSGAILGINRLVKNNGTFEFKPSTMAYGIKVMEWVTPFGVIYLKRHPLFSYEVTNRNSIVLFEPRRLKYRFIDDTTFYPDADKQNTGRGRVDGTDEEYLTEAGLEFHHPETFGYLNGVGLDNSLAATTTAATTATTTAPV